jgi:hypothetical protein
VASAAAVAAGGGGMLLLRSADTHWLRWYTDIITSIVEIV